MNYRNLEKLRDALKADKKYDNYLGSLEDVIKHYRCEYNELKKVVKGEEWPQAVNPGLICDPNSEEDKLERAQAIIDIFIDEYLDGKKFLDFGCGQGHIVSVSNAQLSVGYDINEFPQWNSLKKDGVKFYTNFENVLNHSPYDVILLYDVLDHANSEEEAKKILRLAKSALSKNGKLYVRCHPWLSKHGTHLYHKINKAYLHLIFTTDELKEIIGTGGDPTLNLLHPIDSYKNWFMKEGFVVAKETMQKTQCPAFFKQNKHVSNRIMERLKSPSVDWELVNTKDITSEQGTKFNVQDGIIETLEPTPTEVVTVKYKTTLDKVTGVQLEVLPDERWPNKGPGCAWNGNFALSKFEVNNGNRKVVLSNAEASFSQENWHISDSISNGKNGWAILPKNGKKQYAQFHTLFNPIGDLEFKLHYLFGDAHQIGRLKIYITDVEEFGLPESNDLDVEFIDFTLVR